MPNLEQVKSAIAVFLGAAVPIITFLVGYGVPQNVAAIVTVVLGVAAVIGYVIYDNTHKAQIAKAAAVPGVSEIVVKSDAKDGAAQAAADPNLTNVNKAG